MSKITQYAAITSIASGDVLPAVDVDNTTMAASGTTMKVTVAQLLAAGAASDWFNVKSVNYGATGNGTTDDTTAIQAALTAANNAGGGTVYLPAGTYKVTSTLTLGSNVTLRGEGAGASVLSAASGISGSVIGLASTSVLRAEIQDLTVEVNSLSGITGISLVNTGLAAAPPAQHRLLNVMVQDAGQDGFFYGAGVLECFTAFCFAYSSGRYGFNIANACTDSRWTSCTSGSSKSDGWLISGSNNRFALCKAYYAGWTGAAFTTGHGFHIQGIVANGTIGCGFSCCEAQDCAQNGWYFDNANSAVNQMALTGCLIDSCNGAGAGAGALSSGINLTATDHSSICGNYIFNRTGGAGAMPWAIAVTGSLAGTQLCANAVNVTNGELFNTGTGTAYMLIEPSFIDMTSLSSINVPTLQVFSGDVHVETAGHGILVAEGSNAKQGTLTLNGTTAVVVSNTSVTANSRIFLTIQLGAGTIGSPYVSARTAGTSFSVKSTAAGDTSTCAYFITEPG